MLSMKEFCLAHWRRIILVLASCLGLAVLYSTYLGKYTGLSTLSSTNEDEFMRAPSFTSSGGNCLYNQSKNAGIIFVKTHKTAGTTVTSLLQRLCCRQQCNLFVPPKKHPGKTWRLDGDRGDYDLVRHGKGLFNKHYPYDMWVNHVQFSKHLYDIVPTAKHKIISIVRSPAERFQSAWFWYRHNDTHTRKSGSAKLHMTLEKFINKIDSDEKFLQSVRRSFVYRTGLDATTQELLDLPNFDNYHAVEEAFQALLDKVLDCKWFLLVTNRIDESLLVLARAMQWPMSDILYLSLNENKANSVRLSAAQLAVLYRKQPLDAVLFEAANYMLDKHIAAYGAKFYEDLATYRTMKDNLRHFCGTYVASSSSLIFKPPVTAASKEVVSMAQQEGMDVNTALRVASACQYYYMNNTEFNDFAWRHNLRPTCQQDISDVLRSRMPHKKGIRIK